MSSVYLEMLYYSWIKSILFDPSYTDDMNVLIVKGSNEIGLSIQQ